MPKRKKQSDNQDNDTTVQNSETLNSNEEKTNDSTEIVSTLEPRRKKNRWTTSEKYHIKSTRWGKPEKKIVIPPQLAEIVAKANLSKHEIDILLNRIKLEDITRKINNPEAFCTLESRSPSPPPIYDGQGKRTNTRVYRYKVRLVNERSHLIKEAMVLNPNYIAPDCWKAGKVEVKIPIPQDKYPDYNFFGLIIGPRGNTQKRMERETNCKGAHREGKKTNQPGEDEALHVYVCGENEQDVQKCKIMLEKLLIPVPEETNDHKAKQLRELAIINGTVKDDLKCRICGDVGHRIFECPLRTGEEWKPANIVCKICGSTFHLTADCTQVPVPGEANNMSNLENEYHQFISEIIGNEKETVPLTTPVSAQPPPPDPMLPKQTPIDIIPSSVPASAYTQTRDAWSAPAPLDPWSRYIRQPEAVYYNNQAPYSEPPIPPPPPPP